MVRPNPRSTGRAGTCFLARERQCGAPVTSNVGPQRTHGHRDAIRGRGALSAVPNRIYGTLGPYHVLERDAPGGPIWRSSSTSSGMSLWPRALLTFSDGSPIQGVPSWSSGTTPAHHVECRKRGDILVHDGESTPILAEVVAAFRAAGHWRKQVAH